MKLRSVNPHSITTDTTRAPFDLNVMVVHQGLITGLRANALLDVSASRLGLTTVLRKHFWRFDHLNTPMNRTKAAIEAGFMDVIMLSVEKNEELPGTVQDWMSRCLEHLENRSPAVGVLLTGRFGELDKSKPAIQNVQDFARQAGAVFFSGPPETIVSNVVTALALKLKPRSGWASHSGKLHFKACSAHVDR